jgi:glucosamine-6-phosphate isomerase
VKKIIYDSYSELSAETAEMIAAIVSEKPDALLCFPAGDTSVGTFNHLIQFNKTGKISFKQCRIVGLDEWANLGEMTNENCFSFLKTHLFDHIDYSDDNLCFFNGESKDLEHECFIADEFIFKHGPVDMILLGIGMNGHLGLNEPGTPFDLYSHVVNLDEVTNIVGQKYFSRKAYLISGITLGLKHILEARTLILQVSGIRKAEIVRCLIDGEISPDIPASIIKLHPNAFLLLDKEAAEYL